MDNFAKRRSIIFYTKPSGSSLCLPPTQQPHDIREHNEFTGRRPGYEPWFCHLLAVILNFSFLICEVDPKISAQFPNDNIMNGNIYLLDAKFQATCKTS